MEGAPPPPAPHAVTLQRRAKKRPAEPSLDYENFGTVRRCLWSHSQPTFRRNPDFISHLTKSHAGNSLKLGAVHAEQFAMLGI
eukprot:4079029-Lingulodinium_polyedra.AAC.1